MTLPPDQLEALLRKHQSDWTTEEARLVRSQQASLMLDAVESLAAPCDLLIPNNRLEFVFAACKRLLRELDEHVIFRCSLQRLVEIDLGERTATQALIDAIAGNIYDQLLKRVVASPGRDWSRDEIMFIRGVYMVKHRLLIERLLSRYANALAGYSFDLGASFRRLLWSTHTEQRFLCYVGPMGAASHGGPAGVPSDAAERRFHAFLFSQLVDYLNDELVFAAHDQLPESDASFGVVLSRFGSDDSIYTRPELAAEYANAFERLRYLVRRRSLQDQKLFDLLITHRMDYRQIAEVLDKSVESVRMQWSRLLRYLAEHFDPS
ncbi:MAG: hypothetical protein AAGA68_10460 [Pseudomonadota bacterium]